MLVVVAIMTFSKNAFNALSTKFSFLSESKLIILKDKEIVVHVSFFLVIFYPLKTLQIILPAK